MTLSRFSFRLAALSLAWICAMGSAPAASAQAEHEMGVRQDTLRSPIFDARVADGHKTRRRGVRPRPAAPPADSADAAPRPTTPRTRGTYVGTLISAETIAPPRTAPPPQTVPPPTPPTTRPPVAQAPAPAARAVAPVPSPPVVAEPVVPEPVAPTASEPVVQAPAPSPSVAPDPVALAPSPPVAQVPAPEPIAPSAPAPPLAAPDSSASLFDTRTAWGHKDLPERRPTLFDTRIAWGHKDPAEREGEVGLFDARVAEGHKELPVAEAFAEGPFEVPLDALELINDQSPHIRSLRGTLLAQARYFPSIERALTRTGLPEELKYLALIESALDPQAVSVAGARGIWQIMPETAADFGLDSMDVHDPILATPVAVLYLGRLHKMFDGDWMLALAAYNAGPGRVQRAVRRYEASEGHRPTFWQVRPLLPRETQAYVPRFLAALRYFDAGV